VPAPSVTLSTLPDSSRLRFDPYIWNHTWVSFSMHVSVWTEPAGSNRNDPARFT
jgi:hypothetical protein